MGKTFYKFLAISLVSFIPLLVFPILIHSQQSWVIDGDKVYIDDSKIYSSAYPHTRTSSGWVYHDLRSKVYTGDADFLWGFDSDCVNPKKPQLFNPQVVNWNESRVSHYFNVSNIQTTTDPCDIGNDYNTFKRRATYDFYDEVNDEPSSETKVICFDSFENDGDDYTLYWHVQHSDVVDWQPIPPSRFGSIDYEFGGMNIWYYMADVPIQQDTDYLMRIWLDIEPGCNGKYWFAMKPSDETIHEAVLNNHLYYLDPWYDTNKKYRRNITGVNEQLTLPINGTAGSNVANSTTEWIYCDVYNGTHNSALYYNHENDTICGYESTSAYKVQTHPIVNETGTPPDDMIFYYPLDNSDTDVYGFGSFGYDGVKLDAPTQGFSGQIGSAYDFDGTNDCVNMSWKPNTDFLDSNFTFSFWLKGNSPDDGDMIVGGRTTDTQDYFYIRHPSGANELQVKYLDNTIPDTHDWSVNNDTLFDNNWHHVVVIEDLINDQGWCWIDGDQQSISTTSTGVDGVMNFDVDWGIGCYNAKGTWGNYQDLAIDDFRVYNRSLTENEIDALYSLGTSLQAQETTTAATTTTTTTLGNSCTYGGSGDWNIDCSDNCAKTGDSITVTGNMNFHDNGSFNMTNYVVNLTGEIIFLDNASICSIDMEGASELMS